MSVKYTSTEFCSATVVKWIFSVQSHIFDHDHDHITDRKDTDTTFEIFGPKNYHIFGILDVKSFRIDGNMQSLAIHAWWLSLGN